MANSRQAHMHAYDVGWAGKRVQRVVPSPSHSPSHERPALVLVAQHSSTTMTQVAARLCGSVACKQQAPVVPGLWYSVTHPQL